jgi:hypothetical protein
MAAVANTKLPLLWSEPVLPLILPGCDQHCSGLSMTDIAVVLEKCFLALTACIALG